MATPESKLVLYENVEISFINRNCQKRGYAMVFQLATNCSFTGFFVAIIISKDDAPLFSIPFCFIF